MSQSLSGSALQKRFSLDQARGMLIGLAVGDALGAPLASCHRGAFAPIDGMVGGGAFQLKPGQWAGATSMAMCLAQMLRSANGWDADDAMRRFINWRDFGYLSSTGACFDMGNQLAEALRTYEATGNPYSGATDQEASGNEGIVRVAPVILAYGARVESAQAVAQLQSRLTHSSALGLRVAANMAQFMVDGDNSILPRPDAPPENASDYVMHTIHAAYWALTQGNDFRQVLLAAVNLGGDAGAVGAVTGQLAGRLFGYDGIPKEWRNTLWDHDKILGAADDLYLLRPIDV